MTFSNSPVRVFSIFALSTAFLLVGTPAAPQQAPSGKEISKIPSPQIRRGTIRISPEQIPVARGPLAVLRLTPQKPPTQFLEEVLRSSAPKSKGFAPMAGSPLFRGKPVQIPEGMLGAYQDSRLVGYMDQRTGDAEIFPLLSEQKPLRTEKEVSAQSERASGLAREIFGREDVIAKDDTQFEIGKPLALNGEQQERGQEGKVAGARAAYLAFVSALRTVDGHPVVGPGSRAMLVVGGAGTPQGFLRRWKAATKFTTVEENRTQAQIAEEITAQLRPLAATGEVSVLDVRLAYYDGNRNFLQPVYEFSARVHHTPQGKPPAETERKLADDDFIVAYQTIGKEFEPIPSFLRPPGLAPKQPHGAPVKPAARPGDPTVGRYVVRNDSGDWVDDANEFWSGIASGSFANVQYYWAYPFEFNSSEHAFVNSVNIALNEVHGNWWFFTTYQNWGDGVDITAIPASEGYGAAGGGNLDFWILHSCEVVPSAMDAPCANDSRSWWTPWFNIFRGLHSVVGYRTIMIIDDGVGGPYGNDLKWGAPVVSAWFNETAAAWIYQWDNFWGVTAQAHCGNNLPLGRASTISMCGREDDSAYDTSALPAAGCLVNYWQPN